jgi:hypothetical protein
MRRESHRRRGLYRASSGGFGHRAVYVGAVVAAAAMIAGFGVALVVYGPLGLTAHQISGTTNPIAPPGVYFGNAQQVLASQLDLNNATGLAPYGVPGWNWTSNVTGNFTGPCNATGVLNGTLNASLAPEYGTWGDNATYAANISAGGNSTTLVCLNAVVPQPNATGVWQGVLNATWYYGNGTTLLENNTYNSTNFMPNGSYYNSSASGNLTSCSNWNTTDPTGLGLQAWNNSHVYNYTTGSTLVPCQTYYEMNNNTSWVPSFAGHWNSTTAVLENSSIWSVNQSGYAPDDVVYELPVVFTNTSINGTYAITVAIQGVTPVAQTFYFNDTIGNVTTASNDTVLFTFDMTAAWAFDTSVELNSSFMPAPANASAPLIYGIIGVTSAIVTECLSQFNTTLGTVVAFCPTAAPEQL